MAETKKGRDCALPSCQKCGSQMGAVASRCISCGSDQGYVVHIPITELRDLPLGSEPVIHHPNPITDPLQLDPSTRRDPTFKTLQPGSVNLVTQWGSLVAEWINPDNRPPHCVLDGPCSQCPFRKSSPPGWLGPWNLMELHSLLMCEVYFPCHQTVLEEGQEEGTSFCVGALVYMNNCVKRARNQRIATAQAYYRDKVDPDAVLDFAGYIKHHASARLQDDAGAIMDASDEAAVIAQRKENKDVAE